MTTAWLTLPSDQELPRLHCPLCGMPGPEEDTDSALPCTHVLLASLDGEILYSRHDVDPLVLEGQATGLAGQPLLGWIAQRLPGEHLLRLVVTRNAPETAHGPCCAELFVDFAERALDQD